MTTALRDNENLLVHFFEQSLFLSIVTDAKPLTLADALTLGLTYLLAAFRSYT